MRAKKFALYAKFNALFLCLNNYIYIIFLLLRRL